MTSIKGLHYLLHLAVFSSSLFVIGGIWFLSYSQRNCPVRSPYLVGAIPVEFHVANYSTLKSGEVKLGGWWEPECVARKKVAILVPYRNRHEQLKVFLNHIHPILQRQQLHYRIFVVEQVGNAKFNKGAIYNIGFNWSMAIGNYQCYIFHDVDLLSENDLNYYGCPTSPIHMSPAVDKLNYRLPYVKLVGGIQAIAREHYISINGYSNKFYGWGGEDDDLYERMTSKGLKLRRPNLKIGRYKMNRYHHSRKDGLNEENKKLFGKFRPRPSLDGLSTIKNLNFKVNITIKPFYTLISINLYE